MFVRKLLASAIIFSLFLLSGCRKTEEVWPTNGKKRVLVSFTPLYCFTKNVAGEDVDVRCLLAAQGPHDFSPRENEVRMANTADLILINGLGIDEWINKLLLKNHKSNVFEVGEAIPEHELKPMAESAAHEGHDHGHGEHDPHVWLGPSQAKEMVQAISLKLGELEPAK